MPMCSRYALMVCKIDQGARAFLSLRYLLMVSMFFSLIHVLYAQNKHLDSLKIVVGALPENREKVDLLLLMADKSWGYDFGQGGRYVNDAQQIAQNISYTEGVSAARSYKGQYYFYLGDYKLAKKFYRQVLELAPEDQRGETNTARTWGRLGDIYREQSQFDSARICYQRALQFPKVRPGAVFIHAITYLNIGRLQNVLSRYDSALQNTKYALKLFTSLGDSIYMAQCWSVLGSSHSARFDRDSATHYFIKLYDVAQRYKHTLLQFSYYYGMAELAGRQGENGKAIERYTKAVEFLKKNEFRAYHPRILKRIGQIFSIQGDFNRALEHFLNALEMDRELNSRQEIAEINNLVGWLYCNEQSDSLAAIYGNRALTLAEEIGDRAGVAEGYNLIGYVAYKEDKFELALDYFTRALKLRRRLKLGNEVCATLLNLGQLCYDQGLYLKAIEYHEQIIHLDQSSIDQRLIIMVYNSLARICIEMQRYEKADIHLEDALRRAQALQFPVQMRDSYRLYATLNKTRGRWKDAAAYYEKYIQLNDSIFNSESIAKVAQLTAIYQLSDKEQEIRLLNQENELKQTQIAVQRSRLSLQRNFLIFSITCIVLLAVMAYVLYNYYRAKHKAHEALTQLHQRISEKNEEIQVQSEEIMEANAIISDVNRDLEQKVQLRTEELKQAYIELDTFFYRSSHDFRRPLTTFMGLAEVARITLKDQAARELFEKVKDTAINFDRMLVKLQSISDVGMQHLAYEPVCLKEMVSGILNAFRTELETRHIQVHNNFHQISAVYSYPVLVKTIIENLIENAIQFSAEKEPFIHIRTFEQEDGVCIEIKDNGQGIAEDLKDRIFDMYFRANYRSKGNGLGLYIVKKAIEKISGKVRYSSKLKKGSTFCVTIPLQASGQFCFGTQ